MALVRALLGQLVALDQAAPGLGSGVVAFTAARAGVPACEGAWVVMYATARFAAFVRYRVEELRPRDRAALAVFLVPVLGVVAFVLFVGKAPAAWDALDVQMLCFVAAMHAATLWLLAAWLEIASEAARCSACDLAREALRAACTHLAIRRPEIFERL